MTRAQSALVGLTMGLVAAVIYHIHLQSSFCHEIVVPNEAPPIPLPPDSFFGGCPRPLPTARSVSELAENIAATDGEHSYKRVAVVAASYEGFVKQFFTKLPPRSVVFFSVDPADTGGALIPKGSPLDPSSCGSVAVKLAALPTPPKLVGFARLSVGNGSVDNNSSAAAHPLTVLKDLQCCGSSTCPFEAAEGPRRVDDVVAAAFDGGFDVVLTGVGPTREAAHALGLTAWSLVAQGGIVVGAGYVDASEVAHLANVSYGKHAHAKAPRAGIVDFGDGVRRQVGTIIEAPPVHWYLRR